MAATRFVISPADIGGLAGLVPGEKSPLSPLHIPNPPELTPAQRKDLFDAGLLDQNGLVESAREMLAALSEVSSFARVRVNAPTDYLDEAIHFTGEGSNSVGISNTPDGLELYTPGDAESIFSRIKEFTGSSSQESTTWSVELPPLEMLCLAALMDLRRKAVLHAIVDQQPVMPLPCDVPSITSTIQSMWGNPQWLTNAIQNATAIRTPPAAPMVQAALNALVEKNQVWYQSGNYYPVPEAIQTADRFLLIGTVIHLDAGSANMQGKFTLLRQSWLQAGVTEMLNISQVNDNLRLQLVSPAAALENIHFYFTNFDAVTAPPIETVELAIAIQTETGPKQTFPLAEETVIGRSEQAAVHILDVRASRRHAVIRKLTQGYQLSDAGSTNGTYLNGELVSRPSWLHEGDLIAIGDTRIEVIRSGVTRDQPPAGSMRIFTSPQANPTTQQTENMDHDKEDVEVISLSGPQEPVITPSEEANIILPAAMEEPVPPQEPLLAVEEEIDQPEALLINPVDEPKQPGEALPADLEEPVPPEDSLPAEPGKLPEPQPAVSAAWIQPNVPSETGSPPRISDPEQTLELPEERICPQCGNTVAPEARFCGACGSRLAD